MLSILLDKRLREAVVAVDEMEIEPAWSHIQVEFTSLFSRGVWRCTTFSREPISVLQPRAHLVQMLLVSLRNQTRIWKRKSLLVSAPTGQDVHRVKRVIVLQALAGMHGQRGVAAASVKPSTGSSAISAVKRMQREHMMQRSSSRRMRGPMSTFFGFLTFPRGNGSGRCRAPR